MKNLFIQRRTGPNYGKYELIPTAAGSAVHSLKV